MYATFQEIGFLSCLGVKVQSLLKQGKLTGKNGGSASR